MQNNLHMRPSRLTTLLVGLLVLAGCGVASPAVPPPATSPTTAAVTTAAPTSEAATAPSVQPTETIQPTPANIQTMPFSGESALALAQYQCDIGPRPTGSAALIQTRDWIEAQLQAHGWQTIRQDFTYTATSGSPVLPVHNLLAIKGEGTPLMVGAHFDTRPRADRDPQNPDAPIIGGNDGASGVAVLLELARTLEVPEGRQVQLAFFDAEDLGNINGMPFSIGARYMANNLPGPRPAQLVVVDMIGDADQQIFRERNSDPALNDVIFGIAASLGYVGSGTTWQGFFDQPKWTIIDDHIPFLEVGIPAIDLIDFDYAPWHTLADTCDKLGAPSLERVGRVVEYWLEQALNPDQTPTASPSPTATASQTPTAAVSASATATMRASPTALPTSTGTATATATAVLLPMYLPLIHKGRSA